MAPLNPKHAENLKRIEGHRTVEQLQYKGQTYYYMRTVMESHPRSPGGTEHQFPMRYYVDQDGATVQEMHNPKNAEIYLTNAHTDRRTSRELSLTELEQSWAIVVGWRGKGKHEVK
ncbi:hypothetical protein JCM11491_002072 [Sporobolomyces phaffii]